MLGTPSDLQAAARLMYNVDLDIFNFFAADTLSPSTIVTINCHLTHGDTCFFTRGLLEDRRTVPLLV